MKKLIVLLIIPICFVNCGDDETIDPGPAPSIPPLSGFLMDFEVANPNAGGRTLPKTNWTIAALNVTFWNAIITGNLIVPVASFTNALNKTPSFDASTQSWIWEYTFDVQEFEHHARLVAKVNTSEIQWEMFISQLGIYEDFSWYTGTSNLTATAGTWRLNKDPNNPQPYIDIEWNRSVDGTSGDIRYTNVLPGDVSNGSYIYQQATNGSDHNRFYEIFYKNENRTVVIEWHSENINGRIRDEKNFGDNEFRCWDDTREDIDCPS